jgi:hypothetical protein
MPDTSRFDVRNNAPQSIARSIPRPGLAGNTLCPRTRWTAESSGAIAPASRSSQSLALGLGCLRNHPGSSQIARSTCAHRLGCFEVDGRSFLVIGKNVRN